ncbi:MAG: hypothetical protein H0T89_26435, partial [Deltaproteobacteria bacterium]|nr:hypothetical protein [Deltaproteobacteria bacterium]
MSQLLDALLGTAVAVLDESGGSSARALDHAITDRIAVFSNVTPYGCDARLEDAVEHPDVATLYGRDAQRARDTYFADHATRCDQLAALDATPARSAPSWLV